MQDKDFDMRLNRAECPVKVAEIVRDAFRGLKEGGKLLSKFYCKFIKRAENADEAFFGSFFMGFFAFERVFAEVIDMEVNSLYNSY